MASVIVLGAAFLVYLGTKEVVEHRREKKEAKAAALALEVPPLYSSEDPEANKKIMREQELLAAKVNKNGLRAKAKALFSSHSNSTNATNATTTAPPRYEITA